MTANERVSSEAGVALAHLTSCSSINTLCIETTLAVKDEVHLGALSAALVRVASHPCIAVTLVGHPIGTVAVRPTAWETNRRKDGRHTQEVSITHKSFSAETLAGLAVTGCVKAT